MKSIPNPGDFDQFDSRAIDNSLSSNFSSDDEEEKQEILEEQDPLLDVDEYHNSESISPPHTRRGGRQDRHVRTYVVHS